MDLSSIYMLLTCLFSALIPTSSAGRVTNPNKVPKDAILLSKVESLTFRAGRMTASRRVSPVPQMKCTGPSNVCKLYEVDTMRCKNEGSEYDKEDIQWTCKANLPEEFKLGSTEVSCEGYASSDDPYVLKGSCGVEYRLLLTDKGEEKFGFQPHNPFTEGDKPSTLAIVVFFGILALVLFVILKRFLESCRRNPPRLGGTGQRPPWFGGGGGGGGGGGDDPPPYDSHDFSPRKSRSYGTAPRSGTGSSSRSGGSQNGQGWRPGPWAAGLAGAGLGYALGRNQNRGGQQRDPAPRNSGFFNDGGAGPSNPRSSTPSFSSSRYESTGFGGTSRR